MTKKIITIVITSIIFVFSSCDKEDVIMNNPVALETKDILTFSTQEDFDNTLAKVNAMTKEERIAWEEKQGFKSYGTISDEFYESIEFESIKSIFQLKSMDIDSLLNIYTCEGETIIEPKEIDANERFLMNKNKMYIVSTMVFKIVDSKQVSTHITQIDALNEINSYNDFLSHPELIAQSKKNTSLKAKNIEDIDNEVTSWNGVYMTKVNLQTENYWASFPTRTLIEVEFTIKNYKKAWIGYKLDTQNTNYEIALEAYDESGRLSGQYWYCYGAGTLHQFSSYNKSEKYFIIDGWTNDYITPKFSSVDGFIESLAGWIYL